MGGECSRNGMSDVGLGTWARLRDLGNKRSWGESLAHVDRVVTGRRCACLRQFEAPYLY